MRFMNPDMVYQNSIWAVGLLLVGTAVFGAVLLELCARRLDASKNLARRAGT
jgi:hypothetical protein